MTAEDRQQVLTVAQLEMIAENARHSPTYCIEVDVPQLLASHRTLLAEIDRLEKERDGWVKIGSEPPNPHARYEVRRDDTGTFVATPCYGMHDPWWVPLTVDLFSPGSTVVPMQDTDEWRPWAAPSSPGREREDGTDAYDRGEKRE